MPTRILENAVVRLLKRRPFYGHLLLGLRRVHLAGEHPLGVTVAGGAATLAVNPARLAEYPPAQQEALLEHVVKHLLHLHPSRRKGRNAHDWDIACDLAINPSIESMPAEAPRPERFKVPEGLAAEEYYDRLSSSFDTGNLAGQGVGNAGRDTGGGTGKGDDPQLPVDDHAHWEEADGMPLRLAEELVRGMVRDAWRACSGDLPEDVRPLVESLLTPAPVPWRQVLRQFVATAGRVGRKSTWQREHRRFVHDTPGIRKRQRLHMLVGIDVSESTDEEPLREAFARELVRLAKGRESQLTVLYASSRVQRIDSFTGSQVRAEVYRGGGFTDLRPVFDYARTLHPRPAAVVYLTDGLGPAPESMEFPTLWVLTRDGKKPTPWGVELRLEV